MQAAVVIATPQNNQNNTVDSIWDDEDTRSFYESLPELRALVPGVLLGDASDKEKEKDTKDKEPEEQTEKVGSFINYL